MAIDDIHPSWPKDPPKVSEMATLNLKVCQNCFPNVWFPWKLDKNQKPRI